MSCRWRARFQRHRVGRGTYLYVSECGDGLTIKRVDLTDSSMTDWVSGVHYMFITTSDWGWQNGPVSYRVRLIH